MSAATAVVTSVLRSRSDGAPGVPPSSGARRRSRGPQKDGTLIEGVLDLAFDEPDLTTVVDFKTDHELSAGETRYRAQLQQYVNAVSRVTGRTATGVLFRV